MKFCPACRNALYPIDEDVVGGVKTAILSCRKCEYKEPAKGLIYEHNLREDKSMRLVMNKFMKHDPTLDHLDNVICPNSDCPSNIGAASPDVVPVEVDPKHLVFMYQCTNCTTTWKQSASVK